MSDMLKTFVDQEMDRRIYETYPHLRYPMAVYAKVIRAERDEGETYRCIIRILDKNRKEDASFPEIPRVRTYVPCKAGDVVAVVFLYGDIMPYIIGRAAL